MKKELKRLYEFIGQYYDVRTAEHRGFPSKKIAGGKLKHIAINEAGLHMQGEGDQHNYIQLDRIDDVIIKDDRKVHFIYEDKTVTSFIFRGSDKKDLIQSLYLDIVDEAQQTGEVYKEYLLARWADSEQYSRIPIRTRLALASWAALGWDGGGFIQAVVNNNFVKALTQADLENRAAIHDIAILVYNQLPDKSWASDYDKAAKDQLDNWRGTKGIQIDRAADIMDETAISADKKIEELKKIKRECILAREYYKEEIEEWTN